MGDLGQHMNDLRQPAWKLPVLRGNAARNPQSPSQPPRRRPRGTNLNGPFYMQRWAANTVLVRPLNETDDSIWQHLASWFVETQIGLCLNLFLVLFAAHNIIPAAKQYTTHFYHLAYYNPATGKYGSGRDDAYFITFCIVLFTMIRAATMEYVLAPLGKRQGITIRKKLQRFCEQAWLILYYLFFWPLGMRIYCTSPYYLNLKEMWTDWPNREIDGVMKIYMLAQWAFWLQQLLVVNIEERRKDYYQTLSHHLVTIALVSSCYCYHFTRVGCCILVIMDVVDLFLPAAKCLKYCGYLRLCNWVFGVFVVTWVAARHYAYNKVCWSVYAHSVEVIRTGCYKGPSDALVGPFEPTSRWSHLIEPYLSSTGRVCYNRPIMWAFLSPLLFLQAITIIWLVMIVKVALKVLRGEEADDTRSDDEEEEEEDDDDDEEEWNNKGDESPEPTLVSRTADRPQQEPLLGLRPRAATSAARLQGHGVRFPGPIIRRRYLRLDPELLRGE